MRLRVDTPPINTTDSQDATDHRKTQLSSFMSKRKVLLAIYHKLYKTLGPQHWWPAETPFEVMIGAILTQNTAWSNVEKAIINLKKKKSLSPKKIAKIHADSLEILVRPSGFYKEKTPFSNEIFFIMVYDLEGDKSPDIVEVYQGYIEKDKKTQKNIERLK